jgi:hypothetical protein
MKIDTVVLPLRLVDLIGEEKRQVPRDLTHLLPNNGPVAKALRAVAIAHPDDPGGKKAMAKPYSEAGTIAQVYYFRGPDGTLYADILCYHWSDKNKDNPIHDNAGAVYSNIVGLSTRSAGIAELAELASRQAQEIDPKAAITVEEFVAFILKNMPATA